MQYLFGIHAVDGLLRRKPESIRELALQQGRSDKRIAALETLAATHPEAVLEALSERRGLASEELLRRRIGLQ